MNLQIDDSDLKRGLAELEKNIQKATSDALKAGMERIRTAAVAKLGRRSRAIAVTTKADQDGAVIEAKGVDAKIREYGGTIRAKGMYLVFRNKAGDLIRTPSVRIPARPYLRPAIDANKDDIASQVGKVLGNAARRTK